jgi:hypothetical protein
MPNCFCTDDDALAAPFETSKKPLPSSSAIAATSKMAATMKNGIRSRSAAIMMHAQ